MPQIHSTALVDGRAELAEGVKIAAYAVIKGRVILGSGTVVHEHSIIQGPARIGRGCSLGPAAYLGFDPQHLKFTHSEENPTWLILGDGVTVRETATIHRAIHAGEEHATRLGDRCYIMGGVHIAHDCVLGSDVIMANASLLGGHCQIGDRAFLGGGCTGHQFVRVGRLAIISGNEPFTHDIPPFAAYRYRRLKGYNAIGCRRAGMPQASIAAVRAVFNRLKTHRSVSAAIAAIGDQVPPLPEVRELLEFIATSRRGIAPSYDRSGSTRIDDGEG